MADTITTLLQLTLQETGNNANNWGDILNDTLQRVEDAIANTHSTSTTGGNTTLTDDQALKGIQIVTGALVSNAVIKVPDHARPYLVRNGTSGSFTVSVQHAAGGTAATVPQGASVWVLANGTNCYVSNGGSTIGNTMLTAANAATAWLSMFGSAQTIASASTVDLATATTPLIYVSGNTGITGLGTVAAGALFVLVFTGTPSVTSSGTLTIPGGTRTMAAGDVLIVLSSGGGTWTAIVGYAANGTTFANATVAQYRAKTANKVLTTDGVWGAIAPVALTYSSPYTPDLSTFICGEMTLTGNITMNVPTNYQVGQTFAIRFAQDGTGSRLVTWNAAYKFPATVSRALTTTASAYDLLEARVWTASEIECTLAKGFT